MIADNEALGPRITMSIGNADDPPPPDAIVVQCVNVLLGSGTPISPDEPWTDEELGLK